MERLRGRRPAQLLAQGAALLGVVAGTVAFTSFDHAVSLTVDGRTHTIHAFGGTVGDVLASQHIRPGAHDLVSPALSSSVHDGERVVVDYGRQITVDLNGQEHTYWTTALTVDQALADLGLRDQNAAVSVSRDEPLGRQGLNFAVTMPQEISLRVDGKTIHEVTSAVNVGALLSQLGITLGIQDRVSVPLESPLTPGLSLTVTRIKTVQKTTTEHIAMPISKTGVASMAKGQVKVTTKGKPGTEQVTWQLFYTDGKLTSKVKLTVVVLSEAVRQLEQVGTKASASTGAAGNPGSPGGSAASLNWAALAKCESGGNPKAVNPNGYYGLYQFSLATWHSVGGTGNPIDASAAEQTSRAEMLYNKAGAGQWTCGSHLFDK
jgi:uncharacterized protein YabE (DUF348 family)